MSKIVKSRILTTESRISLGVLLAQHGVDVAKPRSSGKTDTPVNNMLFDTSEQTDWGMPPDRVSVERGSPYYLGSADLTVRFNGEVVDNCIEYCRSAQWVRLGSGHRVTGAEIKTAPRQSGEVTVEWKSPPSRQVRRALARSR